MLAACRRALCSVLHHDVCRQRLYLTSAASVPSFAFDIDGVLKRGKEALPEALEAMKVLFAGARSAQFPFVIMTNGGGHSESQRAEDLSNMLDVPIQADQVILAHTPMKDLVPELQHHPVLISGRGSALHVARSYGFQHAVSTHQLAAAYGAPAAPFSDIPMQHAEERCPVQHDGVGMGDNPIRAILVFTDPDDWYRDLQICSDVLFSGGKPGQRFRPDRGSDVKVVFSQNDLLWVNAHHSPRYGLGAFATALEALHMAATGEPLRNKTFYGKPTPKPYRLAEHMLQQQLVKYPHMRANTIGSSATGNSPGIGPIYMVGDNPLSDIQGANHAGHPWESVLVRTGVWHGLDGDNDAANPAHHVVDTVLDAVHLAMRHKPAR